MWSIFLGRFERESIQATTAAIPIIALHWFSSMSKPMLIWSWWYVGPCHQNYNRHHGLAFVSVIIERTEVDDRVRCQRHGVYSQRGPRKSEELLSTWFAIAITTQQQQQQCAMHEGNCDRRRPDDLNILFLCRKKKRKHEEKRWIKRISCSAVRSTRRARRELNTLFVSTDSSDLFSSSASQTLPRRRNHSS